jgi:hypothetical protein
MTDAILSGASGLEITQFPDYYYRGCGQAWSAPLEVLSSDSCWTAGHIELLIYINTHYLFQVDRFYITLDTLG